MPRDASISLSDHLVHFIDQQVEGGRYRSASDVVQAGLHLLQEREAKLQALRSALIEGETSGDFQEFDADRFLADMRNPPQQ